MSTYHDKKHLQSPRFREKVWDKTGGRCWYCGETLSPFRFQLDHVVPSRKGGSDALDNLVPSCASCNTRKRGGSIEELRHKIAARLSGTPEFTDEQRAWLRDQYGIDPYDAHPTFYFEREGLG